MPEVDRDTEDGPTARDMTRLAAWMVATFTPPQVWHERPASAAETFTAARSRELPGRWAGLRRGYGYAAAGLTVAAVALIWIVQSPTRVATTALVGLGVVLPLVF